MKQLKIIACVLIPALTPQVASAEAVAEAIVRQLRALGYSEFDVSRTFLGRERIVARSKTRSREIVVNPRTGEILRDFQKGGFGLMSDPILGGKKEKADVALAGEKGTPGKGLGNSGKGSSDNGTSGNGTSGNGNSGNGNSGNGVGNGTGNADSSGNGNAGGNGNGNAGGNGNGNGNGRGGS